MARQLSYHDMFKNLMKRMMQKKLSQRYEHFKVLYLYITAFKISLISFNLWCLVCIWVIETSDTAVLSSVIIPQKLAYILSGKPIKSSCLKRCYFSWNKVIQKLWFAIQQKFQLSLKQTTEVGKVLCEALKTFQACQKKKTMTKIHKLNGQDYPRF